MATVSERIITTNGIDLRVVEGIPDGGVPTDRPPVLLIHGQVDSNIPVRHSRRMKLENPDVVLWEVPGADHCGAISVAPVEFERRVIDWFAVHQHAPVGIP